VWVPRAEPCTVFGPCDQTPDSYWIYHKVRITARTDVQPEGLTNQDLIWVKINVSSWDTPDRPMDIPDAADFDAAADYRLKPSQVPAATRETTRCPACLQTRRRKRATRPHTLVWGGVLQSFTTTTRGGHVGWFGQRGSLDRYRSIIPARANNGIS